MSHTTPQRSGCACADLLIEAQLDGEHPNHGATQASLAQHREVCAECRADERLVDLWRTHGPLGPCDPLDELARMRLVHEVLAAHDRAPRRPRSLWLVAPAAAVVSALLVTSWLVWRQEPTQVPALATAAPTPSLAERESAPRSVLIAGEVTVSGLPAGLGDHLGEETTIETGRGSMVLAVGEGVLAHLGGRGRVRLMRRTEQNTVLRLDVGRLLITAPEGRPHRALEVETPAGTVALIGTVVAVDVRLGAVDVNVLRGRAEVSEAGRPRRAVPVGGRLRLGSTRVHTGADTAHRELWQLAHGVEALSDRDDAGVLRISSVPPRAIVVVDGRELGETPLAARVGPGRHVVRVSQAGRSAVRELALSPGRETFSAFDLRAAATTAEPAPGYDAAAAEPTAAELLRAAQTLRAQRQWQAAADTYRRLLAAFPEAGHAAAVELSLGDVLLYDLREHAAALASFRAYLAHPSTPAAEEARLGVALALRAQGGGEAERAAIEELLAHHPLTVRADELRARLRALSGPQPGEAAHD